jgi:hypothetical protein
MAHFAKIENNAVTQVIVVNNEVLNNAEGLDGETLGVAFCKSLYGEDTIWVQTSYNASFRGKFAGMGDTWDGTNFVYPVVEDAK